MTNAVLFQSAGAGVHKMSFSEARKLQNPLRLYKKMIMICLRVNVCRYIVCIWAWLNHANNAKETCGGKDDKMLTGAWEKFRLYIAAHSLKFYNVRKDSLDLKKKWPLQRNGILLCLLLLPHPRPEPAGGASRGRRAASIPLMNPPGVRPSGPGPQY